MLSQIFIHKYVCKVDIFVDAKCLQCHATTDYDRFISASSPYEVLFPPPAYNPTVITPTYLSFSPTLYQPSSAPFNNDKIPFLFFDETLPQSTFFYLLSHLFPSSTYTVLSDVAMIHRFHELSQNKKMWASSKGYRLLQETHLKDRQREWESLFLDLHQGLTLEGQNAREMGHELSGSQSRREVVRKIQGMMIGPMRQVWTRDDFEKWVLVCLLNWVAVMVILTLSRSMNGKGVGRIVIRILKVMRLLIPVGVVAMWCLVDY